MGIDKAQVGLGIGGVNQATNSPKPDAKTEGIGPKFGEVLVTKIAPQTAGKAEGSKTEGLRFSQHALERMQNRGISFKPEDLLKLNDAVEKAAQKGSRESLVLMGDTALIVSVKNKTVVTAMDKEFMKENVFTNIDSTVIL